MISTHRAQITVLYVLPVFVLALSLPHPASAGKGSRATELDRVAYAVEGAESSHRTDAAMWRAEPAGTQGPMQVSEKAAIDVGGGNRLDIEQNRTLGRAYLDLLRRRYGNWVDAISAYNWGMSRVDYWIKEGRPTGKLLPGVARYVRRVLNDSGLPPLNIAVQNRVNVVTINPHIDDVYLPGLEQSGRPLARLANSGRPLPALEQSGHLLSGLRRSAAVAPKMLVGE
jgi:hypothetical protein